MTRILKDVTDILPTISKSSFVKFDNNLIEEMLRQIDLVDILEKEYEIIFEAPVNGWYKTNCPMPEHTDNTPSFGVNSTSGIGIYYCFGCLSKGTFLQFLQKVEGLSFTEALKKLGDISGVEPKTEADILQDTVRSIQNLADLYAKNQQKDLPLGMSDTQLLRSFADKLKYFEKLTNYNSQELEWTEKIYKQIDRLDFQENYKGLSMIWNGLDTQMQKRLKNYKSTKED